MNSPKQKRRKIAARIFLKLCRTDNLELLKEYNVNEYVVEERVWREFTNLQVDGNIELFTDKSIILGEGFISKDIFSKKIEDIIISGNAMIGNITVSNEENIFEIKVLDDAIMGDLNIRNQGSVNLITVIGSGIMGDVNVTNEGRVEIITVQEVGSMGDFNISGNAKVDYFGVEGEMTEVKRLWVRDEAEIFDISIFGMGNIETIWASEHANVKNIRISNAGNINEIWLDGTVNELNINDSMKISNLKIRAVIIKKNIKINDSTIDSILISRNHPAPFNFIIDNSRIGKFEVRDTMFRSDDNVRISSTRMNRFSFSGVNNLGSIFFSSLSYLGDEIKESGALEIVNSKPEESGIMEILDSSLGNTQFIGCDLSSFEKFVFCNSKILNCFLAGTTIPGFDKISVPHRSDNPVVVNDQKRLIYSQIKSLYEGQGDSVRAGEARAYEMKAYKKQLRYERQVELHKRDHSIPTQKRKNLWDIKKELIILDVNRYSSNYGTNWLRAAIGTLIVTVCCFSIYLFANGYRLGTDVGKFAELSSHTLSYLNPFRDEDTGGLLKYIEKDVKSGYLEREKINDIAQYTITPLARIWDYVSRILVAFMVYQTIAAFRRLGKSGS